MYVPPKYLWVTLSGLTAFSDADFLIDTSNFLENFGLYESQMAVNAVIQGWYFLHSTRVFQ